MSVLGSGQTAAVAMVSLWVASLAGCGPGDTSGSGGSTSTTTSSTTTSTSTSGGAGGGGTGGVTGGGGTGGSVLVEDCLDGVDTDGDGLIDCEDPDCQVGFECVDRPVSGWSGALRVQRVPYPAAEPPAPCPDGKPPQVYLSGPSAPECGACQCELLSAVCSAPEMTCSTNTSCFPGVISNTYTKTDTDCASFAGGPPNGWGSCWLTKGAAIQASVTCQASGGALTKAEPWAEEVRVCAAAGAGCGPAEVCAPKAPAGFEPVACMGQEGGGLCPAGWTGLDLPVYEAGTDKRSCLPCACDTSEVHCVGGKYTMYSGEGCQAAGGTKLVDSNDCTTTSGFFVGPDFPFSFQAELGVPTGLLCSQSQALGSVETQGPRRICCRDQP